MSDARPSGAKEKFATKRFEQDLISGWVHEPINPIGKGFVLTHGAGSNCESPLLRAAAEAFVDAGFHVLRYNLPYRQQRASGPPFPALAARDREGVAVAAREMRKLAPDFVIAGGHSYGGRQSSMAAAEDPQLADGLLLLSYPLHPPRKPDQLRTAHFGKIQTPVLFVHGSRDPFGSIQELEQALTLIPPKHHLFVAEKAGHELNAKLAPDIVQQALNFF